MLPPIAELMAFLKSYPQIRNVQVLEYEVEKGVVWLIKVRCELPGEHRLQIRLRLRGEHVEYSYQLFKDRPILRWDNAPHHPELENFPHHFHDEDDTKHPSDLAGDPLADLKVVLAEIFSRIQGNNRPEAHSGGVM